MSSPPFELAKAHRWFAIELNNRAWELIESPARTADETAEMLSTAHASRYHWQQVGTLLNHLRGDALVATAYLAANKPELALSFAQRSLVLCEQPGAEATPFDRACALGAVACALFAMAQTDQARIYYQQAQAEVERFEHADDKALFSKLYPAP